MTKSNNVRSPRRSERGEGGARVVVYLVFLALLGYLAIMNVPTYLAVQGLKQDLAEKARGAGTLSVPVERVRKDVDAIARDYDVSPKDITVSYDGGVLKIKLATTKTLHFLVTDYDWRITQESTGRAY